MSDSAYLDLSTLAIAGQIIGLVNEPTEPDEYITALARLGVTFLDDVTPVTFAYDVVESVDEFLSRCSKITSSDLRSMVAFALRRIGIVSLRLAATA